MPPGGVRCIDQELIHQMGWKVHTRKSITAILRKPGPMSGKGATTAVNSRVEEWGRVAKSKWPIFLLAHPRQKSAPGFVDTSIHRFPLSK
jgi:hypothetical protein